jgi:hypothetical protein
VARSPHRVNSKKSGSGFQRQPRAGVGEPRCRWGHGEGRASERQGLLCSSCQLQQPDLFTAEETA